MRHELQTWLDEQAPSSSVGPLYRLVWSDFQYEWRRGTFNEFHEGVLIRSFTGDKLVPKYSYISERWILEKWYPPEVAFTEELPESREGSYEPIYVFQDNQGNALPVIRAAIEFILHADRTRQTTTQSGPEDKAFAESEESKAFDRDVDSTDSSVISSLLHTKEGIVVP